MAKRMEIEYASTRVPVFQEVARLASFLFLDRVGLADPCCSSTREVLPQHLGREIRQQGRPDPLASRLFLEPRHDDGDGGLGEGLDVLPAPLGVAGVYCDRW